MLHNKRKRNPLEEAIAKEESKAKNKIPYTVQKKIEPQENKHTATNNLISTQVPPSVSDSLMNESEMKYTLKININKKKEQKVKELLKNKLYYGNNQNKGKAISKRERMMKRGFNFIEKGFIEKNIKNVLVTKKVNETKDEENIDKNTLVTLASMRSKFSSTPLPLKANNIIPDIEPWDVEFLPKNITSFIPPKKEPLTLSDYINYTNSFSNYFDSKINLYIQHPVPIKSDIIEKENKVKLPIYLTTRERKKFKKIKKMEKVKDEQEKVKLGLAKPKPPKITYKNFMQIFKDESVTDPSLIEQKVKQAYEERYNKMLEQNAKNQLTKEQKREKKKRKLEKDSKKECRGCLIKIKKLRCNLNRVKIQKNGEQFYLTGLCLMNRQGDINNLLYFEGGPLAVRKMTALIMRRIKWAETEKDVQDPNCEILWEGILKSRACDDWKIHEIKTEADAIRLLSQKGLENMWNLIK